MSDKSQDLTPAERELESALRGLRPETASLDRDRFMFLAGQRSVRRKLQAWRGIAAVLTVAVGVSMAAHLITGKDRHAKPGGGASVGQMRVSGPDQSRPTPVVNTDLSYLYWRERILRGEVDRLPTPAGGGPGPSSIRPLRGDIDRPADRWQAGESM